jgi:hypothetical protein
LLRDDAPELVRTALGRSGGESESPALLAGADGAASDIVLQRERVVERERERWSRGGRVKRLR